MALNTICILATPNLIVLAQTFSCNLFYSTYPTAPSGILMRRLTCNASKSSPWSSIPKPALSTTPRLGWGWPIVPTARAKHLGVFLSFSLPLRSQIQPAVSPAGCNFEVCPEFDYSSLAAHVSPRTKPQPSLAQVRILHTGCLLPLPLSRGFSLQQPEEDSQTLRETKSLLRSRRRDCVLLPHLTRSEVPPPRNGLTWSSLLPKLSGLSSHHPSPSLLSPATALLLIFEHARYTLTLGPLEGCFLCLEGSFIAHLFPSPALSLRSNLTFLVTANLTMPFKITTPLPPVVTVALPFFLQYWWRVDLFRSLTTLCLRHRMKALWVRVAVLVCLWT